MYRRLTGVDAQRLTGGQEAAGALAFPRARRVDGAAFAYQASCAVDSAPCRSPRCRLGCQHGSTVAAQRDALRRGQVQQAALVLAFGDAGATLAVALGLVEAGPLVGTLRKLAD